MSYHRTVITIEVLSEGPYEFQDFEKLTYDVTDGDCSGMVLSVVEEEVDATAMAKLLEAQGSEPSFLIRESSEVPE